MRLPFTFTTQMPEHRSRRNTMTNDLRPQLASPATMFRPNLRPTRPPRHVLQPLRPSKAQASSLTAATMGACPRPRRKTCLWSREISPTALISCRAGVCRFQTPRATSQLTLPTAVPPRPQTALPCARRAREGGSPADQQAGFLAFRAARKVLMLVGSN